MDKLRRVKAVFIIMFIICLASCKPGQVTKNHINAVNGILDLSGKDIYNSGIYFLDGQWEFFYDKFLNEKGFDTLTSRTYIRVPGVWNKTPWLDKKLPGTGHASYRLKLFIKHRNSPLSLKIPDQATSYRLYVDDSLIASAGKAGIEKKSSKPEYRQKIITFTPLKDTFSIILQVSNFHFWKGGIFHSILMGSQQNIFKVREFNLTFEYFLAGALFLLFFYLFGLYLYRKKEKTALYFSLFSVLAVFRILSTGELFITELIPGLSWEGLVKIDLLSYYLIGPVAGMYFHCLFKKEFSLKVINVFTILGIAFSLVTVFFPASIHSHLVRISFVISLTMVLYVIYGSFMAVLHKRQNSLVLFFGTMAFVLTAVNDILYNSYIINTLYMLPVGLLILFLLHALMLARKFSTSFNEVEDLSYELYQHKIDLEGKVVQRTQEIEKEKQTSEKLLLNVLPVSIASRLKTGETPIADLFDEASVIFIDIVDFTKFSSTENPKKIVEVLNSLFSSFDKILAKYNIEKIKTIGDCYMAAAGIPEPRPDHLFAITNLALEILEANENGRLSYGADFQFRIGLDAGEVIAGVIGEQKFAYDLWGDVVNMASRMENHGVGGKVQCSERFMNLMQKALQENSKNGILRQNNWKYKDFLFIERGKIEVKGKGLMQTWFMEGRK